MVEGDCVDLDVTVHEATELALVTQSSTKVGNSFLNSGCTYKCNYRRQQDSLLSSVT